MDPQTAGRLAALVVAILIVPLLMLAAAPEALACSCAPASLTEQVARGDVVFTGRAVGRAEPSTPVASSADEVTWTFDVDQVHKGDAEDPQQVGSARSEASCGLEFDLGTTYFVVAETQPGGALTTGLCGGTHAVAEPPPAVEPRRPAGPTEAGPASPLVTAGLAALAVGGLVTGALLRRRRRS